MCRYTIILHNSLQNTNNKIPYEFDNINLFHYY